MSGCRSAYPAYGGERDGDSYRCARCGAWCHRNRQTRRWKHGRALDRIAPTPTPVDRSDPYAGQSWASDVDRAAPVTWSEDAWRSVWESWHAFTDYACQAPVSSGERKLMASHNPEQDDWAGGSWQESERLARDGWHDAIMATDATATDLAYKITAEHLARDWTFPRDVVGDAVDVATFLSGEPECMQYAEQVDAVRGGDVVRLAVPVRAGAHVPESLFRARGAAIVALVDVLTTAGFAVEVWAVDAADSAERPAYHYSHAVRVQHASDPLDMGRIMFALAHPCMLRRIGFAAQERVRADLRMKVGVPHGYGMPVGVTPDALPAVDGPTIVLPLLEGGDDWSAEAAERWIVATLDSLSA